MSQLLDDLKAARSLIEDPKRWTKGVLARPSRDAGVSCWPSDEQATCWCALGAALRIGGSKGSTPTPRYQAIADALDEQVPYERGDVAEVNDEDGHAAILALFDKAIAAEEAKR